jgi:plasmid stability protein
MPSVQIKNVPPDVHSVLRRRAAESGKSLQEYLLGRLTDEAHRPTLDEVLDDAGRERVGSLSFATAVEWLREDRESH